MPVSLILSPAELDAKLSEAFPKNATCWSQATDEVRDMCRAARETAGVPDAQALDFRALSTPAEWNTQGIEATVRFYTQLNVAKRQDFCENFAHWLGICAPDGSGALNAH